MPACTTHRLIGGITSHQGGYFRVPRRLACSEAHGPRGLAHVNLASGAVGVIDKITKVRSKGTVVSVDVLADAVISDTPLAREPLVAAPPQVLVAPEVEEEVHHAPPAGAARAAIRRGKRPVADHTAPVRASARIKAQTPACYHSTLDRAVELKKAKMGTSGAPSAAPPPLTALEIRGMIAACQLPRDAANDVEEALLVPDGANA